MRLLAALTLAALIPACTTDSDEDVRVERQASTLDEANASGWSQGGAVLVALPGTFAFPQPLSVRISVIDSKMLDDTGAPTQLRIMGATVADYGTETQLTIKAQPTCAANFCSAELEVAGQGASMLKVEAQGPNGKVNECFYYGIYEADDPDAAGTMHRTELEKQQRECRATYWN